MFQLKSNFYNDISDWIKRNPNMEFYLYVSRQDSNNFLEFCSAIIDNSGIPVIITNISSMYKPYPVNIRMALNLSDKVRLYEVSKMCMDTVLYSKANLFTKTNGGIIWTP